MSAVPDEDDGEPRSVSTDYIERVIEEKRRAAYRLRAEIESQVAEITRRANQRKTVAARASRTMTKRMLERHEQMQPFVAALAEKYCDWGERRVIGMADELLRNPAFAKLLRGTTQARMARRDIAVILEKLEGERGRL
jgi:hypothetical protein